MKAISEECITDSEVNRAEAQAARDQMQGLYVKFRTMKDEEDKRMAILEGQHSKEKNEIQASVDILKNNFEKEL